MVLRHPLKSIAVLLNFFSIALLTVFMLYSATAIAETMVDCNAIHTGPCTKKAAGRSVTLEITPRPVRHMAELAFKVTVDPCATLPSTLMLDLSMPGMHMGKNQVVLTRKSTCTWEGKGVIVRCMSGRKLWQATILSTELGSPAFTFDVHD
jgi:hypothetical protein